MEQEWFRFRIAGIFHLAKHRNVDSNGTAWFDTLCGKTFRTRTEPVSCSANPVFEWRCEKCQTARREQAEGV